MAEFPLILRGTHVLLSILSPSLSNVESVVQDGGGTFFPDSFSLSFPFANIGFDRRIASSLSAH